LDLAANALYHGRDLTRPVGELRLREAGTGGAPEGARPGGPADPSDLRAAGAQRGSTPTVALPELRRGRVGIVSGSIFARSSGAGGSPRGGAAAAQGAYAAGQAQLAYYQALHRLGEVRLIRGLEDLEHSVADWRDPSARTPIGLIAAMECADPILEPEQAEEWRRGGLLSVSLTHFGVNVYGYGTGTEGGLHPRAYPLLEALRAAGIVLDLSHCSDRTFWQILERWDGPVYASHSNCRALVPGQRQLSDEMIRAIAERGGVIGMVFAEPMLNPAWDWNDRGANPVEATRAMSAVVDHVDHVCGLLSSGAHVGIGSDLDGGFGRELAPTDLDTVADLQKFPALLRERGYDEGQIAGICHGNLLGLFRRALGGGL
jgi:membrane dipeptidase